MKEPENAVVNGTQKRKDSNPSIVSPNSLKKRRVLEERSPNIAANSLQQSRGMKGSSQPVKSSFEEDLDRLTQEIGEVGNCKQQLLTPCAGLTVVAPFETDQKWARPPLKPFDPETDSLSKCLVPGSCSSA